MSEVMITVGGGTAETVIPAGKSEAGTFSNAGLVWTSNTLQGLASELSTKVGNLSGLSVPAASLVAAINAYQTLDNFSDVFDGTTPSAATNLEANLIDLTNRIKSEFGAIRVLVGGTTTSTTSGLATTATNLVAAINEVRSAMMSLSFTVSAGSIDNSHINNSAAIALTKLAALAGLATVAPAVPTASDTIEQAISKIAAVYPGAVVLTSDFASTSTTRANVTGMTIPVTNGHKYVIELIGTYKSDTITNGCSIGLAATTATGTCNGFIAGAISNSAVATELKAPISSLSSSLTLTDVGATNTPHSIHLKFAFTCTATGSIQIQFGAEVSTNTSTLLAGTALTWRRVA